MSIQRAIKFCNLCYEYNKEVKMHELTLEDAKDMIVGRVNRLEDEELQTSLNQKENSFRDYSNLRDNATNYAMQALESLKESFESKDKVLNACKDCDYKEPKMVNFLSL